MSNYELVGTVTNEKQQNKNFLNGINKHTIKRGRNKITENSDWSDWDYAKPPYPSEVGQIFNNELREWAIDNLDTWMIYDIQECREVLTIRLAKLLREIETTFQNTVQHTAVQDHPRPFETVQRV